MTTYSNPRLRAEIFDWPMGRNLRGTAIFTIESKPGKGERGVRVTICNGRESAPKTLTYARKARIVDGDDGKTYIAELSMYGGISFMQSNMKFQSGDTIFPRDERYAEIMRLFD
jgi:hypothetical protein